MTDSTKTFEIALRAYPRQLNTQEVNIAFVVAKEYQRLNDKRIAELEEKLRVAEVDAERLRILMNMSGEYYAESVKHQFVGRLQEFIDRHANEVSQAIDEALKTIEV